MSEESETSWSDIQREKKLLFQDVLEKLSDEEFMLLKEILSLEHENRHLDQPHHMKQQVLNIIERVIE